MPSDDEASPGQREICSWIKKARLDAGLSQAELGRRIGITQQAFNKLETGRTKAKVRHLTEIATHTGGDFAPLLAGKRASGFGEAGGAPYDAGASARGFRDCLADLRRNIEGARKNLDELEVMAGIRPARSRRRPSRR